MPLPQESFDQLYKNCRTTLERLLVLLLRDLEGRRIQLANLNLADIDVVAAVVRLPTVDGRLEQAKLGRDAIHCFREHVARRSDNVSALFVTGDGRRLGNDEVQEMASRLAEESGLEFDGEEQRFRVPKADVPRLVKKTASRDLFYLYGIVSHPVRRQIVELLGDSGPIGFTQIKQRLNLKVGTLYYHFDMLAGLVKQDTQKRYFLTDVGKDAYRKLRSPEYVQAADLLAKHLPIRQTSLESSFRLLIPSGILSALQSRTWPSLLGAGLILGMGCFSVYQAHLSTVLLFLDPSDQDPAQLALGFILNWIVVFGVADSLATYLFGRTGEHLTLLVGTTYALFPLLLFVGWWDLAVTYSINAFGLTTFGLSRIVLIVLQAWSLALLARLVGVLKGLRLDKAAVISLALAYLSIMVAYLRGV